MKILSVVGARPQFVKAAPMSSTLKKHGIVEVMAHTGQHYDANMSAVFFEELAIPPPAYSLGVGSGPHGAQTGAMLAGLETIVAKENPDWVMVYGDTNSTLAGALAAAKLHVRVAHVEAGLRSFNRAMPEELNRILADHLSDLLLCPSFTAAENLRKEGIEVGVALVGDVMADALALATGAAARRSDVLERIGLEPLGFLLATVHRAENTDDPARFASLLRAFKEAGEPVVFPVHPRARKRIEEWGLEGLLREATNLRILEPLGYLDMVRLEQAARMILTDSGGMQKEAYWLGVPCLTLREETEWVETVDRGWNRLVGTSVEEILSGVGSFIPPTNRPNLYGGLGAAERCLDAIVGAA